nr:hypothetical protein [Tanacetum cinerariifolium]
MTLPNPQRHVVPTTILTKSKLVPITVARPITDVVLKPHATRPRQAKTVVTKPHSPPRRTINRSSSPKASTFPLKVTAAKDSIVNAGNPQHALKDKGVIESGCSRRMTGNMAYLSGFEELNDGYVVFVGNPKGGEESAQQYLLFPVWSSGSTNPHNTNDDVAFRGKKLEFKGRKPKFEVYVSPSSSAQTKKHDDKTKKEAKGKSPVESLKGYRNLSTEFEDFFDNRINEINVAAFPVPTVNTSQYPDDLNMPELEDITYSDDEEDVGAEANFTNLETTITVSPIPTTRVHKDHLVTQIIGDLSLATQTRKPKRVHQALKDPSWIEAMQEELLQFKMQKEEGIDYEEVFAPVARIEAIRLFLAYASFMGFMVYQMDVKCAFLYGTIEEEIYVDDIIFGSTNKDLCKAFEKLMKEKFQMSSMGELIFFLGFQVKQKPDGIFICQDKYVAEILRKFGLTEGKSASTPIDTEKPLLKDPNGVNTPRCDEDRLELMELTVFSCYQVDEKVRIEVNDVMRLQALADKKKVIITEATIRDAFRLDDAQSIDCLPNEKIFTELSRMGGRLGMSLVPLWVQLSSAFPQVFANMKRVGKGFSRVDTPLFKGMIVAQQDDDIADECVASVAVDDVPTAVDEPSIPSPTPTTQPPPPS